MFVIDCGPGSKEIVMTRVTGMSADFWLGLQQDWDLWHALRSRKAAVIETLEPLLRVG
jgi:plasmid maintenance system antidote protein VapI